jgi:xylulokinase
MAGVGCGTFNSYQDGVQAMVKMEHIFEPDPKKHEKYNNQYEKYRQLWPLMQNYLRGLVSDAR